VRQLPSPVRWAAVTAVTIAASTGCMSISDEGGKPAPSRSAEQRGSSDEPDGSTAAGTGRARTRGGAEAHSDREAAESPSPSASARASVVPGGVHAGVGSGDPLPTRGGHLPVPSPPGGGGPQQPVPSAEPSVSSGPSAPVTPEPSSSPDPEPSSPPPAPSASPAAQFRSDAMSVPDDMEALRTPEASPQVGPV
jgi:hypothetical protein